jgi:hypothetical protein
MIKARDMFTLFSAVIFCIVIFKLTWFVLTSTEAPPKPPSKFAVLKEQCMNNKTNRTFMAAVAGYQGNTKLDASMGLESYCHDKVKKQLGL